MKINNKTFNLDLVGNALIGSPTEAVVFIEVAQFDHFSSDRQLRRISQSLAVRALLASTIDQQFGRHNNARWQLDKADNGRPFLSGKAAPAISLSHSGDWCASAVANMSCVGVDVEVIRPKNWHAYGANVFHPVEEKWVLSVEGTARDLRGMVCWCRKEALIKAVGLDIAMPLDEIGFSPEGDLIALPTALGPLSGWNVFMNIVFNQVVVAAAFKT